MMVFHYYLFHFLFQMADSDRYVFENEDSDDQKAEEEEQTTLAANDTWVSSVLNSPFFLC